MENDNTPKTLDEALANGWETYDSSLFAGYVSRKISLGKQVLHQARGKRKGQFYFEKPNFISSRYAIRVYIKPPIKGK
jgi:hypothetical protein